MIDQHGYRPNVGIVLCNGAGLVLWAKRCGGNGWQFPQGGIQPNETPQSAMYRELNEEIGLSPSHVEVLGQTRDWLYYDIPNELRRRLTVGHTAGEFRGQKQIWFLLRLLGSDADVCLDTGVKPEFVAWRWIEYWHAVDEIINFKRDVYRLALAELEPLLKMSSP